MLKIIKTIIAMVIMLASTALISAYANTVDAKSLQNTSYTFCSEPNERNQKSCVEYHLRENGQALRMFWHYRVDTGLIENHSISHRAWRVKDTKLVIQGEHEQWGEPSIFYYDVYEITESGDAKWVVREIEREGGVENDKLDVPQLYKKNEAQGPKLFKERMARDSRWSKPELEKYELDAYWSKVVSQYPAKYLRD